MVNAFLFDTDVLIDYLRAYEKAVSFLEKSITTSQCYLSVISVAELYAGIREGKEKDKLEKFLTVFEIIALNDSLARQGGLYRRDYSKSHGVSLADALIAASAEHCGAQLITLNKKHFPMTKNLYVPYRRHES